MRILKQLAAALPDSVQIELESHLRGWQLRTGRFTADEPEFKRLGEFVQAGDWVLDVGANIGHYTLRLSQLVGATGRVLALEPIPRTFSHLARLVVRAGLINVTLINAAASDRFGVVRMEVPKNERGLRSYYQARIGTGDEGRPVLALPLGTLHTAPRRISLIKVDVEGHEMPALAGMREVIASSRPVLIVEGTGSKIASFLAPFGYRDETIRGSPNRLFIPEPPS